MQRMNDHIGIRNGRPHHRDVIGIAGNKRRATDRLAVRPPQSLHRPARIAKSDHRRIADMAIAAQNRHFTLGHSVSP